MIPPRRFYLYRRDDVTGISGTGVVAWGVEFHDGTVVSRWCVGDKPNSTVLFDNIRQVEEVHGHGGKTAVVWVD